jgi:flagellar hook protein FlgE
MGISSALYSGVSGLNTNSQAMTVIGNNLANTNTLGFKGARTVFSDLLSSTINGSGGLSQVGRGVNVSKVDNVFSQGTFESTESPLDVAIEGDGFFLVSFPGTDENLYTRAGAFRFDNDGFLINPEGYRVQGQPYDANGDLVPGSATDIQITNLGLVGANVTTEATLSTNLDATEDINPGPVDITDPTTFNYTSSTQVFDTVGNPHLITFYFNKTANNQWEWSWSTTASDGTPIPALPGSTPGTEPLNFLPDGLLEDPLNPGNPYPAGTTLTDTIPAIDWLNGTTPTEIILSIDTTQFNSDSVVISQDQNGYGAGELAGVNINEDGVVIASYANGEQVFISNLVLGKFTNPNGLESAGNNLFKETTLSGIPRTGLPGIELGKVFTNSLEQSNVDMGAEFVRMITVQRGFQANSKIITTVDELLGELINLKR